LSQLSLEIVKHYIQQFVADEYIVRRRTSTEKKREKLNLEEIKENKLAFYSSLLKNQQYSSLNFEILLSTMESAGIEAGLLISSSEDRIKKVDLKNYDSIFGVMIRILSYIHEHVYMSEKTGNIGTITVDGCFECAFAKKIPRKKICTFTNGLIKGVIKYLELVTNEMIYNKVNVVEKTCYANKDASCSWEVTLNF